MSKMKSFLMAGAGLIALTVPAFAAPPGRVGRISLIEGSLSTRNDDNGGWGYATINEPVTTGDSFWAQDGSRGEVQVGGATVRVDGGTELDVVRLDDTYTELNVPQGAVSVEIAYPPPGGVVIDTPQGKVTMNRAGIYSIVADTGSDDDSVDSSQATVFSGDAAIDSLNSHVDLHRGQAALWSSSPPSFNMVAAQESAFDQWARMRDRALRPQIATEYVTPEMTGYEDLGTYGNWAAAPDYGQVWYPNDVDPGWVPYRDGRWAYVQPWGWTWIDSHPWGFAPFHYGRWVQTGGRWGWWPGEQPRAERPVYAPALVAFLSFGHGGTHLSVSDGPAVGWVPLAPYEVYRPWYSQDPGYWQRVNRPFVRQTQINNINVTTINNVTVNNYNYSNRAAALAVPADSFGQRHTSPQHVPAGAIGGAGGAVVVPQPFDGMNSPHRRRAEQALEAAQNAAPAPPAMNSPHRRRVEQAQEAAQATSSVPAPVPPAMNSPHRRRVEQAQQGAQNAAPVPTPVPTEMNSPHRRHEEMFERQQGVAADAAANGAAPGPAPAPTPESMNSPHRRHEEAAGQTQGATIDPGAAATAPAPAPAPGPVPMNSPHTRHEAAQRQQQAAEASGSAPQPAVSAAPVPVPTPMNSPHRRREEQAASQAVPAAAAPAPGPAPAAMNSPHRRREEAAQAATARDAAAAQPATPPADMQPAPQPQAAPAPPQRNER